MLVPTLNYFSTLSPCKLRELSYHIRDQFLRAFIQEGGHQDFQSVLYVFLFLGHFSNSGQPITSSDRETKS